MRRRGLVGVLALLLCVAGCDEFGGFPRRVEVSAFLMRYHRIEAAGTVSGPRFGAGPGLYLAYTAPDLLGTMSVHRLTVTSLLSTTVSVPGMRTDLNGVDTTPLTPNGGSEGGAVSGSGGLVAFVSRASNLLEMDTLGTWQAYLRDVGSGTTTLLSQAADRAEADADVTGVALGGSGRFVAFSTAATNLSTRATNGFSQIFLYDRTAGTTSLVSHDTGGFAANGDSFAPVLSPDGRFVAFHTEASDLLAGDTNDTADVVVYDRATGLFDRASVDTAGAETLAEARDAALSNDGRFVAYSALPAAGGVRQVYLRDRSASTTTIVSADAGGTAGDAESGAPALSGDGAFLAFHSDAANLDPADSGMYADVFVYDRVRDMLARASIDESGTEGAGDSRDPSLSPDGQAVAFASAADNLVAGDTTSFADLFIVPNRLFR